MSGKIRLNQCTSVRLVLFCNVVGVLVEIREGIGHCRGRMWRCCSYLRSLVELMGFVHGVFAYSNEKIHERLASPAAGAVLGEMNNQYWPVGLGAALVKWPKYFFF